MHTINYWGHDQINIGCIYKPVEWWVENYKKIGEAEHYTPEQIEEYGTYIEMIRMMHEKHNQRVAKSTEREETHIRTV